MGADHEKLLAAARAYVNGKKAPAKAARSTPAVPPPAPPTRAYSRLAAQHPEIVMRAQRKAPAPKMFHSGDVPPFLASGADPSVLARLPEQIRHYAAKAPMAEFGRLVAEYADRGPDADLDLQIFEPKACSDPGWFEYLDRLANWAGVGKLP